MDTKQAYNLWSKQYDTDQNKTRDLEAKALREVLDKIEFQSCLEIGCGTGKNTEWLLQKAGHVTAVDLSDLMLNKAKEKITSGKVKFIQADITRGWDFTAEKFDLVSFSLVLEHIENLDHIFREAAKALSDGGHVYVGELHPYKQYSGTKARFENEEGLQVLDCYLHNISDFLHSAKKNGLEIMDVAEYFDEGPEVIPRVLAMIFRK